MKQYFPFFSSFVPLFFLFCDHRTPSFHDSKIFTFFKFLFNNLWFSSNLVYDIKMVITLFFSW